jgi:hypothetical protein
MGVGLDFILAADERKERERTEGREFEKVERELTIGHAIMILAFFVAGVIIWCSRCF